MSLPKKNIPLILFFIVYVFAFLAHLKPTVSQEKSVAESFSLLLIIALLIVLTAVQYKASLAISAFDLICLLFVFYLCIKESFTRPFDSTLVNHLIFLSLLYVVLKSYLLTNKTFIHLILPGAAGVTLLGYIIFAAFLPRGETMGRLPNQSIFSILLASQTVLILPLSVYLKTKRPLFNPIWWFSAVLIIATVVLLGLTKGRAGWLGFIVSIMYILYRHSSSRSVKKAIRYEGSPLVLLLLILLIEYKSASSNGRILIYKISANILKENWLWGIGTGQFKVKYNQYQAAYFAEHSIDSKEALLADNTFYVFNDLFQLIIENGLVGALFISTAIILLIRQINRAVVSRENSYLFTAVTALLICVLTGSLFSYPLQMFPVTFLVVIALAVLYSFPSDSEALSLNTKQALVCLPIGIYLIIQSWIYWQFSLRALRAFNLERTGFKQEALKQYKLLANSGIKDGNMLYQYAQALYHNNQPALAVPVLKQAKRYYCAANLYTLSARLEFELQHYSEAEKDYQTAVFMVPNKMISRYDLLSFYIETKDTANIVFWSKSILNMPVKVPSSITSNIHEKAKAVLLNYRDVP